MHSHAQSQAPSPEAIELGHEPTAVNIRALIIFTVVFVVATVIVYVIVWYTMIVAETTQAEGDPPPSPLGSVQRPQPWLQPSKAQPEPRQPWQDREILDRRAESILDSYGPGVAGGRTARIPIRRAMELLADRGLPTTRATSE